MKTHIVKLTAINLLAAAIMVVPAWSRAQDSTNATVMSDQSTNATAKPKKHGSLVAGGKVSEVDTNAMTLTVGKHTFIVTSETKITKDGAPAVLSDIAVGDKVGIAYKKTDDGKFNATTIHDGKKPKDEEKQ